jgi:DUF4097 and DUF4098 domain-containing protein YvlB
MKMKNLLVALVAFSIAMMLQAGKTDLMKKRFEVHPGKQVTILYIGVDDDVTVEKHDKNEILFSFEKEMRGRKSKRNLEYFEEVHPEIDFKNNTLEIEIKYPKRSFNLFRSLSGFRVRVTSRLLVPANSDIKIRVVDGDVDVSDIKGKAELKTVDGDIMVKGCTGPLNVRSTDGDIEVNRSTGTLRAHTVDGDVTASGVFSSIQFKSVDGEGEFMLHKGSQLNEDCMLRTVDGDIRLAFPEDFAFKLDFKGGDGDVEFHNIEFENVTIRKENRFQGERGDATYTIQVRTGDGDLSIEEL